MVIYPVSLLRIAMGAAERGLDAIDGRRHPGVPGRSRCRPAHDLYELVDYEAYNRFDNGVFNFQVPDLDIDSNNANL